MAKIQWDDNLLLQAFSILQDSAEVKEFLIDLLTENEIKEFTNRFLVAKMLNEGKSYLVIESETRMSSTTIARVSKCLKRPNSGYQTVINRL